MKDVDNVTVIDFSSLEEVTVTLELARVTSLQTVTFPLLNTARDIRFDSNNGLISLDFPSLLTVTGTLSVSTSAALASFSIPTLETVTTKLELTGSAENLTPRITSFEAPALRSVGELYLYSMPLLLSIAAPALETCDKLIISKCRASTSHHFPVLHTASTLSIDNNLRLINISYPMLSSVNTVALHYQVRMEVIELPLLTNVNIFSLQVGPSVPMTTIEFPSLVEVREKLNVRGRSNNDVVQTRELSFPALRRVGKYFNIYEMHGLTRLNCPELEEAGIYFSVTRSSTLSDLNMPKFKTGGLLIQFTDAIEEINFPLLEGASRLSIINNTQLQRVNLPLVTASQSYISLRFYGNPLLTQVSLPNMGSHAPYDFHIYENAVGCVFNFGSLQLVDARSIILQEDAVYVMCLCDLVSSNAVFPRPANLLEPPSVDLLGSRCTKSNDWPDCNAPPTTTSTSTSTTTSISTSTTTTTTTTAAPTTVPISVVLPPSSYSIQYGNSDSLVLNLDVLAPGIAGGISIVEQKIRNTPRMDMHLYWAPEELQDATKVTLNIEGSCTDPGDLGEALRVVIRTRNGIMDLDEQTFSCSDGAFTFSSDMFAVASGLGLQLWLTDVVREKKDKDLTTYSITTASLTVEKLEGFTVAPCDDQCATGVNECWQCPCVSNLLCQYSCTNNACSRN